MKRRFGYARLVCLALLIGFAALRVLDPPRSRSFGSGPSTVPAVDPRDKTARPVTIVDIDDKSLEKLGQWPWPRTRIADLVTDLTRLGAVVIAFDVVFSEPDRLNPDAAADTMRNLDEATRASCGRCRATTRYSPTRSGVRAWCSANPAAHVVADSTSSFR